MKKIAVLVMICASALFADTAETAYFRGKMSPDNETPAVPIKGSASATLIAHIVRDNSGKIVSGSVDFNIDYLFPGAVTLTGLHIHNGPAGVAGPITIRTDLGAGAASIVSDNGIGSIAKQGQILTTDTAALDTINGMMTDPSQYYVNIHSVDFPGGAMRAQLQRAEVTALMGMMSPDNETPPIPGTNASGVSQALVIATRDGSGALTSGQVIFDINYNFGKQVTITGFHIHNGAAGVAGPVIINTGLGNGVASITTADNGVGTFRKAVEVDLTNAAQLDTLKGLLSHPKDYYINMHNTEFPGGLIRDQLRTTDEMKFSVTMLPANETPPVTGIAATAPTLVTIRTIRAEDGSALAGVATFDVNYRFPVGHFEFTGLHVHDGAAGIAGPVRLNSNLTAANPIVTESGFGNIFLYGVMSDANAVATLNSLVANPELHYVNVHTSVNPSGVAREQLAPVNKALPVVTSGGNSANGTAAAPAGLIAISGTDLTKVAGDLSGWQGKTAPTTLNGSKVTIGGKNAPVLIVSPKQITAQVPVDVAAGSQPVIVTNSNGASTATNVTIAGTAPAIFADSASRGVVTHQNFDLVGAGSPAKAGELLILWATGLGQTTPALATGAIAVFPPENDTQTVTVTIGGQDAKVTYSIASPGFPGLYQIAVTMPTGVAAGNAPVVLKMGAATSAAVNIAVQ